MHPMVDCLDLRIGGTLSSSGITGGQTIQVPAHGPRSYTGLLGHPGFQNSGVRTIGRPGVYIPATNFAQERLATLDLLITGNPLPGETISDDGACWELDQNTDRVLAYMADPDGFYLERDLADGSSRFLQLRALSSFPIATPAVFTRTLTAVLTGVYPWWRAGGAQSSNVISGATTVNNPGTASVQDLVLSFAGDAILTNSTTGQSLEIDGSSGTVTVDVLAGSITQGGNPADNLLVAQSDYELFRLDPGDNSVSRVGANVTITWRAAYD